MLDERPGLEGLARPGPYPHRGEIVCFRGREGGLVKVPRQGGAGMSLHGKRLEDRTVIWPARQGGAVVPVSAAPLGYRWSERANATG